MDKAARMAELRARVAASQEEATSELHSADIDRKLVNFFSGVSWVADRTMDFLSFVEPTGVGRDINMAYAMVKPVAQGSSEYYQSGNVEDLERGMHSGAMNGLFAVLWGPTGGRVVDSFLGPPGGGAQSLGVNAFRTALWWGRNAWLRDPAKKWTWGAAGGTWP